jgi:NADH-quinone oxidoreductase subunit M
MVAYASVSHMGVVLLGIATLNAVGLAGAVMQMVAHGLVAAALFLLVGLLYSRTHRRDIADYGALWPMAPRFAVFASIALMAAIGVPGTASFVAELYALIGGLERFGTMVIVMMLAALVSAAYALRTLGRFLSGPAEPAAGRIVDLGRRETMIAAALCLAIIALGFIPGPLLALSEASLTMIARGFAP